MHGDHPTGGESAPAIGSMAPPPLGSAVYREPPTFNAKCIALTIASAALYWYLPPKNKWILLFIASSVYLAIAWYDHVFACQRHMGPTYLSLFYIWFKPQSSVQLRDFRAWDPAIRNRVLAVDLLILLAAIGLAPRFLRWQPNPPPP